MKSYEMLYIINASLTDEQKQTLTDKVKSILEANGATDIVEEKWGTKKYAYTINYTTEGYYTLVNFKANVQAIKKVSDLLNITENVVRHMIVAK